MRTVYLGTSEFAAEVLDRSRSARTARSSWSRGPTGRARPGPQAGPAAGGRGRRQARHRDDPAGGRERRRVARADRRARAGGGVHLRLRRADQGAAALGARDGERPSVAPAALARRGADRAGDRGGRRGDGRDDHAAHRRVGRRARSCLQRGEPIHSDDDYGTLAARLAALGGELLVEALDDPPPWREQPDQGVTLRREDRSRGPPARPRPPRGGARAPGPRAHAAHGGLRGAASGERLGVRRAALVPEGAEVEQGALRGATDGETPARHSRARSSCSRCSPPGGRPMDAGDYLRGRRAAIPG